MQAQTVAPSPFKVGFLERSFCDPRREHWSEPGPRPVRCAVWYPADTGAVESTCTIGGKNGPLFVVGEAAEGASLVGGSGRLPVVLVSHGTGGSAKSMGGLGIRLARSGYVALAVNHHGNTAVEPYRPEGFLCWWERARDLTVALDQVCAEPHFHGRLDPSRVFAAGFSLGGYTALALAGAVADLDRFDRWRTQRPDFRGPREFPDLLDRFEDLRERCAPFRRSLDRHGRSYRDARVKAVLACAPAPPVRAFTTHSLARIDVPVSIVVAPSDQEAPYADCACWLNRHLRDCRMRMLGTGAGHYVFLCEATELGKALEPAICIDAPDVDRREIHDVTAAAAVQLFREADSAGASTAPESPL